MSKKPHLENFMQSFFDNLPPGLHDFKKDLKNHTLANLDNFLNEANLVTREEFDIQKNVLLKTRAILKTLEQRITYLEKANK